MQVIIQSSGLNPNHVKEVLKALDSVSYNAVSIVNVIAMTKEEEKAQLEMMNNDDTNNLSIIFSKAKVGEE